MILQAILNLRPGAKWYIEGDSYDKLTWVDETQTKPTLKEVQAEIKKLEQEAAANKYKTQRAEEYPSIGDQLDALFKAGVFPKDMADQIQAIKDKYPKGE